VIEMAPQHCVGHQDNNSVRTKLRQQERTLGVEMTGINRFIAEDLTVVAYRRSRKGSKAAQLFVHKLQADHYSSDSYGIEARR
jgi:hypothetical protein